MLPFADVEDTRAAHDHGDQLVREAGLTDLLQAPVPVVVVVGAEVPRATPHLLPHAAVQRKAHVVFAAHPWRHFRL